MNIFLLDYDSKKAVEYLANTHVVKMTLETSQVLCSPFEPGSAPYRRTHYNHPCCVWARESYDNYMWLIDYGMAIASEYTHRYGKRHKSQDVIEWCNLHAYSLTLPTIGLTPFKLAMPEKYHHSDPVKAYRDYYVGEKAGIAKWTNRNVPYWFKERVVNA